MWIKKKENTNVTQVLWYRFRHSTVYLGNKISRSLKINHSRCALKIYKINSFIEFISVKFNPTGKRYHLWRKIKQLKQHHIGSKSFQFIMLACRKQPKLTF